MPDPTPTPDTTQVARAAARQARRSLHGAMEVLALALRDLDDALVLLDKKNTP